MRIAIIYGNQRKESTYHCVKKIKDYLINCEETQFDEFFLPGDMPHFCLGCFNCFLKGESTCPHYAMVKPIKEALINADGIIFASPVYGFDVTGAMKALLDHLCYLWMPHRPDDAMFTKIALLISTTAGGGAGRTLKTIKNALSFMGIKRIDSYGVAVAASSWGEVKPDKKQKITKVLNKRAEKFYHKIKNRKRIAYRVYTRILFLVMKQVIHRYDHQSLDMKYWLDKGWLGKKSPFHKKDFK